MNDPFRAPLNQEDDPRLTVLVVDSNLKSQRSLQRSLQREEHFRVVGTHKRGRTALNYLRKNKVDVVLLNPELNDLNGFDMVAFLTDPPLVVIVSDRYDYGFYAYQIGAIEFLTSDHNNAEFRKTMGRVKLEYDRRKVYAAHLEEQKAVKEQEAPTEEEAEATKS